MDRDPPSAAQGGHGVATYYDRLAAVYGDGEYFRARRAAVLAAIGGEIAGAQSVLDLGCGNGVYLGELGARNAGARLVGADLSPEMLQTARQRLRSRTALTRGDATALPFRRGSFDLVFMSHVLLLIPDIETCIAEVVQVLAPGGTLAATVGSTRWRDAVAHLLGGAEWDELEALFASGLHASGDDEERAISACVRHGLEPELRHAGFSVDWQAVEEWVRIRWFTVADEAMRTRGEHWLAQVRAGAAGLTLPLSEAVLVARRPIGGVQTAITS